MWMDLSSLHIASNNMMTIPNLMKYSQRVRIIWLGGSGK